MNGIGTTTDVAPEFVDVRGRRTQVMRKGEGPPVVYLHSATGETYWTDLDAAIVDAGFTVFHPAHPGYEGSEGLADIEDIHDLAFHTLDLLDGLALDRVSLVGSSLGGWLAAEVAVYAPERIERLVLVDPAGIAPPAADMWAIRPPELAELLFGDQEHWMAQLLKAIDVTTSLPPPEILMPLLQAMEASARVGWNPHMHDPKLPGRLHRVRAPTLVIWGDRDGLMPLEHADRWLELIAGARLEVIPGCGHLAAIENPSALAEIVIGFLRGA
ncbi:MAG: alpha/beta fold hydrolase [Actinomycetota bacterium]